MSEVPYRIQCGEIWGGIEGNDLNVETSGVEASLFCQACDGGKGGDLYYLSVCKSDLLTRIAIADVMGHGERVSRTSQWLYDSLQSKMNSLQGSEVLEDLNKLAHDYGAEAISTATVASIYRPEEQFLFSYAGHHPAIIYHAAEDQWRSTDIPESESQGWSGLPLGVRSETTFQQGTVPLATGDRIAIYTDGVIEAMDANGQTFGEERLINVLNETVGISLQETKACVLDKLVEFSGNNLDHDDVTFLIMDFRPPESA